MLETDDKQQILRSGHRGLQNDSNGSSITTIIADLLSVDRFYLRFDPYLRYTTQLCQGLMYRLYLQCLG